MQSTDPATMMEKPEFKMLLDRHGKPFATWENPPGLLAELNAEQLLELAQSFLDAAEKLKQMERKGWF